MGGLRAPERKKEGQEAAMLERGESGPQLLNTPPRGDQCNEKKEVISLFAFGKAFGHLRVKRKTLI